MYFFATRKDGRFEAIRAYEYYNFPLDNVSRETLSYKKKCACQAFGTFDIETTTISDAQTPFGFMYHWQMCIDGLSVYGRTWQQWSMFMQTLIQYLSVTENRTFIIYIHNLSYEYQFIRQILERDFGELDVFATDTRKPLVVRTSCGLEFRCSYTLSNMTLEKATETQIGCKYIKASGDLDYKIIRYPDTPLSDTEFGYCMMDTLSLYHYIQARLREENDTLLTIPLTSTGYVRRDTRNACKADRAYYKTFQKCLITPKVYDLLAEAGRGGDTGANRYLAGVMCKDVDSFDVVSSYPYQLLTQKFPMTRFYPYGKPVSEEEIITLSSDNALLFRAGFKGLRLKPNSVDAYLPSSKSLSLINAKCANGRVLRAEECVYTLTELDFEIIRDLYTWDSLSIGDFYTARKALLPQPIRDVVLDYFIQKCELAIKKSTERDEHKRTLYKYLYAKSKNKLNGIFGMMYTNPVRDIISQLEDGTWKKEKSNVKDALAEFYANRNNFLVYAWGVWTTAHARKHLQNLIFLTGEGSIYWDTDSSKAMITEIIRQRINNANEKIKQICIDNNAFCKIGENTFYLGLYEHETAEGAYRLFKTLGAKKYSYVDSSGRLHVTISGVNKAKGASELSDISHFNPGFIFYKAGGSTLYYNSLPLARYSINNHTIEMGDNIGMVDSTYKLGITKEYAEIIAYNAYSEIV